MSSIHWMIARTASFCAPHSAFSCGANVGELLDGNEYIVNRRIWWQIGMSLIIEYHSFCSVLNDHRNGHKFVVVESGHVCPQNILFAPKTTSSKNRGKQPRVWVKSCGANMLQDSCFLVAVGRMHPENATDASKKKAWSLFSFWNLLHHRLRTRIYHKRTFWITQRNQINWQTKCTNKALLSWNNVI